MTTQTLSEAGQKLADALVKADVLVEHEGEYESQTMVDHADLNTAAALLFTPPEGEGAGLREAAQPFAAWIDALEPEFADHDDDTIAGGLESAFVTFGHLRRLRAALASPRPAVQGPVAAGVVQQDRTKLCFTYCGDGVCTCQNRELTPEEGRLVMGAGLTPADRKTPDAGVGDVDKLIGNLIEAAHTCGSVGAKTSGAGNVEAISALRSAVRDLRAALAPQPPKAETPAGVGVVDAMAGYLRVCASGGMPSELREKIETAIKQAASLGYFAALSTAPAVRPGDGVGVWIAPDEPTPEMERAFDAAYWAKAGDASSPTPTEHPDDGGGAFGYGYRAMRKAAPEERHRDGVGPLAEIAAERRRQVEAEGWTPEHDDTHSKCELARAAACYVLAPSPIGVEREWVYPGSPKEWPWSGTQWKPSFYRRNLVKACALLVAEIERWDRQSAAIKATEIEHLGRFVPAVAPAADGGRA